MAEVVVAVSSVLVGLLGIGKVLINSYVKAHERALRAEKQSFDLLLSTFDEKLNIHDHNIQHLLKKVEELSNKYDRRNAEIKAFVLEFRSYVEAQNKRIEQFEEQLKAYGKVTVKGN